MSTGLHLMNTLSLSQPARMNNEQASTPHYRKCIVYSVQPICLIKDQFLTVSCVPDAALCAEKEPMLFSSWASADL